MLQFILPMCWRCLGVAVHTRVPFYTPLETFGHCSSCYNVIVHDIRHHCTVQGKQLQHSQKNSNHLLIRLREQTCSWSGVPLKVCPSRGTEYKPGFLRQRDQYGSELCCEKSFCQPRLARSKSWRPGQVPHGPEREPVSGKVPFKQY